MLSFAQRHPTPPGSRADAVFQSTLWSQVRRAGRPEGERALEMLCRLYWTPIYAFLRRCGHERQNAQDLTQGFFVYLLQEELLRKADPERGRFRSFLLGALKFFVSNEQARARALKRGGGASMVPIDPDANDRVELFTSLTPERLFERKWALAVIAQAMERLEAEYQRADMAQEFALLQPYLTGEPEDHLSDLALRLGKSHSATRIMMFRVRNRFRRLIRAVIADTVADASQVESELAQLQAALRDA
jgi:hypothetical protein